MIIKLSSKPIRKGVIKVSFLIGWAEHNLTQRGNIYLDEEEASELFAVLALGEAGMNEATNMQYTTVIYE